MEKINKTKAVTYCRVSSKEQEREGYSIPAQEKLLKNHAQLNQIEIVKSFVDIETAKQSGRKQFSEMIRFLEGCRKPGDDYCRTVLVEKTDRLYRNFRDYVLLEDLDLEICLVKEGFVLSRVSKSNEKFVHGIKVLMAKNYIDNLGEEAKKGMLEKAEQGIFRTKAPLGYVNVTRDGKKYIEVDQTNAQFIRKLFDWYATGNYSLKDMADKMYDEGFRYPKSGAKVHKSAVHTLLKNPIYYGEFSWRGKLYKGAHEPIIERGVFNSVQVVLNGRNKSAAKRQNHKWAFTGLIKCGECGSALTAEKKKGKYVYYHCTGSKWRGEGKCPNAKSYVSESTLNRQFSDAIKRVKIDDEVLEWLVSALKDSHKDEKRYHDNQIQSLNAQYTKIQNRLDTMYEDKLDGHISQEFFLEKSNQYRNEQEEIRAQIENHEQANQSYLEDGAKLFELSQNAVRLYEQQTMLEKRKLLNFVLSNSVWKDGQLTPEYRKPFNYLVATNEKIENKTNVVAVNFGKSAKNENWLGW